MSTEAKTGIAWDLDGTLYQNDASIQEAWTNAFYQAGLAHGLEMSAAQAKEDHDEGFKKYGHAIRWCALKYGIEENMFFETMLKFMDVKMIDPCHHTRDHFIRNISREMVVLTSAHKSWALPVLRHIGLDHLFPSTHIIAYNDTDGALKSGSEKPFRMAAEALSAKPEQLIMVEDTPANLVIARDLGMTTVLVTHGAQMKEKPSAVDFIVDKAYDVFHLIEEGVIPWQQKIKVAV